ncbi:MAG: hypothetical protein P8104_13610 [Gammaproteobacteria bacterium]
MEGVHANFAVFLKSETTQKLLPSPDSDQFEGNIADLDLDQKNFVKLR